MVVSGEPSGDPPVGFMTPWELGSGRGNQVRGQTRVRHEDVNKATVSWKKVSLHETNSLMEEFSSFNLKYSVD